MKKLIKDLLQSPSGKYSRKSFMIFVTFGFTILLGAFIVISDKILDKEINRYGIDVFNSLLLFLATMSGFSIYDKKVENKSVPNVTEETQEA